MRIGGLLPGGVFLLRAGRIGSEWKTVIPGCESPRVTQSLSHAQGSTGLRVPSFAGPIAHHTADLLLCYFSPSVLF